MGALEAFKQAGRWHEGILIAGALGGVDDAVLAIADGELVCGDYQSPFDEAYWCTMIAYANLSPTVADRVVMPFPSEIMLPCALITPDNVDYYIDRLNITAE